MLTAKISFACSCGGYAHQFNLYNYDIANGIYEYHVIKELKKDTSEKFSKFQRSFQIKVLNSFKGKNIIGLDTISIFTWSSCSFFPTINETYISYSGSETPDFEACQRKLTKGSFYFEHEKESLLNFKKNSKSKLILSKEKAKIVEGKINKGIRNGVWKIYYPISKYSDKRGSMIFLELTYKNGKLVNLKKNKNEEYYSFYSEFNRKVERYYSEKLDDTQKKK